MRVVGGLINTIHCKPLANITGKNYNSLNINNLGGGGDALRVIHGKLITSFLVRVVLSLSVPRCRVFRLTEYY